MHNWYYLAAVLLALLPGEMLIADAPQQHDGIAQLPVQLAVNTQLVQPIWTYEDSVALRRPTGGSPAFQISFSDGKSMLLGYSGNSFTTFSFLHKEIAPYAPALGGFPMWNEFLSNQSLRVLARFGRARYALNVRSSYATAICSCKAALS